ncbi:MAG: hypothetical protein IID41_05405 [Planctomycetes bacterium]|nr:hypothetical protein [Planctomycetota bacterium]
MIGVGIYAACSEEQLRQGEILSDLIQVKLDVESLGKKEPAFIEGSHPLAIVMTQDCDLESDYRARRSRDDPVTFLPNVLLCPLREADEIKRPGPQKLDRDIRKQAQNNKNERYHYLRAVEEHQDVERRGLPATILDFKRYFTIPTDELYRRLSDDADIVRRRCRLNTPFAEHLSCRFFYFQMRVALPEEHWER